MRKHLSFIETKKIRDHIRVYYLLETDKQMKERVKELYDIDVSLANIKKLRFRLKLFREHKLNNDIYTNPNGKQALCWICRKACDSDLCPWVYNCEKGIDEIPGCITKVLPYGDGVFVKQCSNFEEG